MCYSDLRLNPEAPWRNERSHTAFNKDMSLLFIFWRVKLVICYILLLSWKDENKVWAFVWAELFALGKWAEWDCEWVFATDPLQRPVTFVQRCRPGPWTAAASRRRPSSQDETGSPQSSDNEHSSGRLQTDTGRGGSLWLGKSNKHIGLHPTLALRQSHIMAIQSHFFFFSLTTCFSWQQMS